MRPKNSDSPSDSNILQYFQTSSSIVKVTEKTYNIRNFICWILGVFGGSGGFGAFGGVLRGGL